MKRAKLTPVDLIEWAIGFAIASLFVSCGIAALVSALR